MLAQYGTDAPPHNDLIETTPSIPRLKFVLDRKNPKAQVDFLPVEIISFGFEKPTVRLNIGGKEKTFKNGDHVFIGPKKIPFWVFIKHDPNVPGSANQVCLVESFHLIHDIRRWIGKA